MNEDLLYRLSTAMIASCSCMTKTPELKYHDPLCPYRLYAESKIEILKLCTKLQLTSPTN